MAHGGSRELADPVERFAKPLLHLDTPASATWVTPASIHLFSGQDHSVSAQAGGVKAITANAALSVRAHTDAQQYWSEQDLTVQSTTDEVRIQAQNSITLMAGQSQIVIEGGNIIFTCPGTWTVKGASHDWLGGGSGAVEMARMPDSRVHLFDEAFVLKDPTGQPLADLPFKIKTAAGYVYGSSS